jgi:hypothetical protein
MDYKRCDIPNLYQQGFSLNKVSELTGVSYPTVRRDLMAAGIRILTKKEGVARHPEGWNRNRVGVRRSEFSDQWKENIKKSARARWDAQDIKGVRVDSQGYLRYTAGENHGRQVHVVIMEARLGRSLFPDEEVHHIDRNKGNCSDDNLALVTKAGHGRLHRFEDKLEGKVQPKGLDGRFLPQKQGEN